MRIGGAWLIACVGGCYAPDIPVGLPCGAGCPDDQVCVAGLCQLPGGEPPDAPGPRVDADPRRPDAAPTGCWDAWLAGTVTFGMPRRLVELETGGFEGDAYLATDGVTLYFSRGPGGARDFYRTTRQARGLPFGPADAVAELSSTADESRLAMTGDARLVVLASTRPGLGGFDLYQATRDAADETFDLPSPAPFALLNDTTNQHDPWLSPDGLRLYYAPPINGTQQIHTASRGTRDGVFGPKQLVDGLAPVIRVDPTLSPDERVIVYSGAVAGGAQLDLYVATRATPTDDFTDVRLLDALATASSEADPALSADGCELFFGSDRDGSDRDLYVVEVRP